jgi:hypothetical protein
MEVDETDSAWIEPVLDDPARGLDDNVQLLGLITLVRERGAADIEATGDRAVELAESLGEPGRLADALLWRAHFRRSNGHLEDATADVLRGLGLLETGDPLRAWLLLTLSTLLHLSGADAAAQLAPLDEAIHIARDTRNQRLLLVGLGDGAWINLLLGNDDRALAYGQDAYARADRMHATALSSASAHTLAIAFLARGATGEAAAWLRQAVAESQRLGTRHDANGFLQLGAAVAAANGDDQLAATLAGASERGAPPDPLQWGTARYASWIDHSRSRLGPKQWATLSSQGEALGPRDALALLEELYPPDG